MTNKTKHTHDEGITQVLASWINEGWPEYREKRAQQVADIHGWDVARAALAKAQGGKS